MKTLFICEKPSVAQEISNFLEGTKKNENGYYVVTNQGDTTYITFAFGHLIRINNNEGEKWDLSNLPIFPSEFTFQPVSPTASKQLNIIKDLIDKSENIVISTDAGREGELIGREILEQYSRDWRRKKTVKRLWTSEALTKNVFDNESKNLKDIGKFDHIYFKAIARQQADWMVGINLTRHTTLKSNAGILSIGRVQTPILAMIVDRCKEVETFKKEFSYSLVFNSDKGGVFDSSISSKIQADIDKEVVRLKGEKLQVNSVQTGDVERIKCPSLHSLTTLQREANRKYGFTAQETLDLAQNLYEKYKCLSYPRTDSQHLAESSKELLKKILIAIGLNEYASRVDGLGKEIFDSSKLTDHHALIVLDRPQPSMSEKELKIYNLVLDKIVGFFLGDYKYKTTTVVGTVKDVEFKKTFRNVIEMGWRTSAEELEENEETGVKIDFREGELLEGKTETRRNETRPKKLFNEDLLLEKMEKLGLGTPATRHQIIKILEDRNYIFRDGKNLKDTVKGRSLIECKLGSEIISPEMTAEFEKKIESIANSKNLEDFLYDIKDFIRRELSQELMEVKDGLSSKQMAFLEKLKKEKGVKSIDLKNITKEEFIKTKEDIEEEGAVYCGCGDKVKEGEKAFFCPKCNLTVYKIVASKKIPRNAVKKLFLGEKVKVTGFTSKTGNKFDAFLVVKNNKVEFEFETKSK